MLRPLVPLLRRLPAPAKISYEGWLLLYGAPDATTVARMEADIADWTDAPSVSVVLCACEVPSDVLTGAVNSICAQNVAEWELCVALPAAPAAVPAALEKAARADARIHLVRAGTDPVASRNAAASTAQGRWLLFMGANVRLAADAIAQMTREAMRRPEAMLIYADEDRIDRMSFRHRPYFKSSFDPELLLTQNYFGAVLACRADLFGRIGGFRTEAKGSADHDLALRAALAAGDGAIRHVPLVLCHVATNGADGELALQAPAGLRSVVEDAVAAAGEGGTVAASPLRCGGLRVVRPMPRERPLVSIVVPTRDRISLLQPCMDGVLHKTDYPAIEILIVDNGSTEPETAAYFTELARDPRVNVLSEPGPFNYSKLNNKAVAKARGDVLLLLNNDIEVMASDWLDELVSHAVRPGVGAVGPKLLYPDLTVQHAGVLLGLGWPRGVAGHVYAGEKGDDPGPFDLLASTRSVSAVTGACLAVRRKLYEEVGGLDEESLTVAFNDVDFCLRLRERGYRNIWTPFAVLLHKESASRGDDLTGAKAVRFQGEIETMRARWAPVLDADPYWNPNLTLTAQHRGLAEPPRVSRW